MPELFPPFVVASSFRLPGLGILVLPTLPEPSWLTLPPLHTALSIRLVSAGPTIAALPTGTIEEVLQDGSPPSRALLLDLGPETMLPAGTHLIASEIDHHLE